MVLVRAVAQANPPPPPTPFLGILDSQEEVRAGFFRRAKAKAVAVSSPRWLPAREMGRQGPNVRAWFVSGKRVDKSYSESG